MNTMKACILTVTMSLLSGCYAHHPHDFHAQATAGAILGAVIGGAAGYAIGSSHSRHRHRYGQHGHHRNRHGHRYH